MFTLTERLSSFMYGWMMDATEESYNEVLSSQGGHGMEYCLFFLLGISLVFTLIYYFGVAADIRHATPKNYLLTMVMGYIVLAAVNYLGIATLFSNDALASFNLVKITLIDIVYYIVLFEVFSLMFKNMSKASGVDFISILFNKNV